MKRSKILSRVCPSGSAYRTGTKIYKPFSYYVKGGADLDGSATRNVTGVMHDDPEDIEAGLPADGMCDAHIGFDDMVEELGSIRARNLNEAAQSGVPSGDSSSEPAAE